MTYVCDFVLIGRFLQEITVSFYLSSISGMAKGLINQWGCNCTTTWEFPIVFRWKMKLGNGILLKLWQRRIVIESRGSFLVKAQIMGKSAVWQEDHKLFFPFTYSITNAEKSSLRNLHLKILLFLKSSSPPTTRNLCHQFIQFDMKNLSWCDRKEIFEIQFAILRNFFFSFPFENFLSAFISIIVFAFLNFW